MGLNTQYIPLTDLEGYFVDKDTGLPLANGILYFYSDINRTTPKNVYQLTGSPPNYGYGNLGSVLVLSSVGTVEDQQNNNIIPYAYPYDADQNVELYYIECYNENGVRQFTREGVPNVATTSGTGLDITNYVPNGQFLAHTDIPNGGALVDSETTVAQGGWSVSLPNAFVGSYNFVFNRISTAISGVNDYPRYAGNFICTSTGAGTDDFRDLNIKWPDVNKFASSTTVAQDYTVFFNGASNDSNTYVLELILVKYFGTGGSALTERVLTTFSLGPSFASYKYVFDFGNNNGKTIGVLNDDYVALVLRSTGGLFNFQVTDFSLVLNNTPIISFPTQTNASMLSQSIAGWLPTPAYDGSDLYLPFILTREGATYDMSGIGSIVGKVTPAENNELLCDGSSYPTTGYSSLGIPYSRIQNKLFSNTLNAPIFGTATDWANAYISVGLSTMLILSTNQTGSQTNAADGTTATGFTFNTGSSNPGSGGYNFVAHANSTNNNVTAISTFTTGALSPVTGGNSGLTVAEYGQAGVNGVKYAFVITAAAASALAAGIGVPGLYFEFSNGATNFYMWFSVNGETDPAVGGKTGARCRLGSNFTASDTAIAIANVLTGFQNNLITVTGQPTGGAGSFFSFYSNGIQNAVWYQINGLGTAPAVNSKVKVSLTGTETAAQVATATQRAINSVSFRIPDLRGVFLRGLDDSIAPTWDEDIATRTGLLDSIKTTFPGTLEFMSFQSHNHDTGNSATDGGATQGGGSTGNATGLRGSAETRPVNFAVNWFIKY